jgi:hypothetical protein
VRTLSIRAGCAASLSISTCIGSPSPARTTCSHSISRSICTGTFSPHRPAHSAHAGCARTSTSTHSAHAPTHPPTHPQPTLGQARCCVTRIPNFSAPRLLLEACVPSAAQATRTPPRTHPSRRSGSAGLHHLSRGFPSHCAPRHTLCSVSGVPLVRHCVRVAATPTVLCCRASSGDHRLIQVALPPNKARLPLPTAHRRIGRRFSTARASDAAALVCRNRRPL